MLNESLKELEKFEDARCDFVVVIRKSQKKKSCETIKMIKMKLKNKWFICTSAIGRALRIALQDPSLYLDLCREAGFCLYRLNTASSLRCIFTIRCAVYVNTTESESRENALQVWTSSVDTFLISCGWRRELLSLHIPKSRLSVYVLKSERRKYTGIASTWFC